MSDNTKAAAGGQSLAAETPRLELFPHSRAAGRPGYAGGAAGQPSPSNPQSEFLTDAQSAYGNQAILRMLNLSAPLSGQFIQRKCAHGDGSDCQSREEEWPMQRQAAGITINPPGDEYEREADRTADLVMRAPLSGAGATGWSSPVITSYIQRQPDAAADAAAVPAPLMGPSFASRLVGAATSGSALPPGVRSRMEARFGMDFSLVRVHAGPEAGHLSNDIDAIAFTHGRDIYFAPGAYSPGTPWGELLLAHELTHVVQQCGGSAAAMRQPKSRAIQRARNVEIKRYYFTGGGLLSGKAVHEGVETRLLAANSDLIVEAPIPGGTTDKVFTTKEPDNFDVVGRADLYKAQGAAVGVRGEISDEEKGKDFSQRKREYRRLRTGGVRANGGLRWEPDAPLLGGKITGAFPGNFAVADLKPLGITKAGEGWVQIDHYKTGMTEFAKQAKLDGALTQTGTVTGTDLTDLQIPDGLNYWKLDGEPSGRPGPGHFIVGTRRYWVAPGKSGGLYYYFDLSDLVPSRRARAAQERVLTALALVRQGLKFPEPGPNRTVQLTRRRNFNPAIRTPAIQRQPAAERPRRDWEAEGKTWERSRTDWDTKSAKPFLKTSDAKSIGERADAEKHLAGGLSVEPFKADAKGFKAIELWSGTSGKLIGYLRFKFGSIFDKVVGFYERIREKFKHLHGKVMGIESTGISVSWQRKLISILLKALKIGFVELLKSLYQFFADCMQGLLNKVVRKFTEDLSEELATYMDELSKKWDEYSTKFKEEFESRFGRWDTFIADLQDVNKWIGIASDLITLIRIGVQVISCLAPPALGCLWGLVVQLTIESGVNLLLGTKWLDRHIIRPTIRNLISRFAGPAFQRLLDDVLDLTKLTEFAADVGACHRGESASDLIDRTMRLIPEEGIDGKALLDQRDQWYRDNAREVQQAQDRARGDASPPDPKKIAEESAKAQQNIRKTLEWPDQKAADEMWFLLYSLRDQIGGAGGGAANGGEISELADAAAQGGLTGQQVRDAVKKAPKRGDSRATVEGLRSVFGIRKGSGVAQQGEGGGGSKPGSGGGAPPVDLPTGENKDQPSVRIPPLSIWKRYKFPGTGPVIEPGPQVFNPPPGQPEKDPTVLPGVEIPLGR